jgi:hypothetical protein
VKETKILGVGERETIARGDAFETKMDLGLAAGAAVSLGISQITCEESNVRK